MREDERLRYTSQELKTWIETTCETDQDISNWCRRWGTNKNALERFISGSPSAIHPGVLRSMSRDTGISLESLVYHAELAGVFEKEVVLTPKVYGSSTGGLIRLALFPAAVSHYRHRHDFAGSKIWIRALEDAVLPPAASREIWVETGLRLLDQKDFVWDFRTNKAGRFGRWRPSRSGGRVALLNLTLASDRVTMGERIGTLTLAPKVPMRCAVYDVPPGGEADARRL